MRAEGDFMGFWGIIGAGWRGAFGALRANLPVFGLMFVVGAVVTNIGEFIAPIHMIRATLPSGHTALLSDMSLLFCIQTIVTDALICAIVAPCMVAVHRHILLHEDSKV